MNLQSVLNVMQYKQNNSKKNIFILKIESPRGLNANQHTMQPVTCLGKMTMNRFLNRSKRQITSFNLSDKCFAEINPSEQLINQHLIHLVNCKDFQWWAFWNVSISLLVNKWGSTHPFWLRNTDSLVCLVFKSMQFGSKIGSITQIPTHQIK